MNYLYIQNFPLLWARRLRTWGVFICLLSIATASLKAAQVATESPQNGASDAAPPTFLDNYFAPDPEAAMLEEEEDSVVEVSDEPFFFMAGFLVFYLASGLVYAIVQEVGNVIVYFGWYPTLLTKERFGEVILIVTWVVFFVQLMNGDTEMPAPKMSIRKKNPSWREYIQERYTKTREALGEAFSMLFPVVPKVTFYTVMIMTSIMCMLLGYDYIYTSFEHKSAFEPFDNPPPQANQNADEPPRVQKVDYNENGQDFIIYGIHMNEESVKESMKEYIKGFEDPKQEANHEKENVDDKKKWHCDTCCAHFNKKEHQLILHQNSNNAGDDKVTCKYYACLACIAKWSARDNLGGGRAKCMQCGELYTPRGGFIERGCPLEELCAAQLRVYKVHASDKQNMQQRTALQAKLKSYWGWKKHLKSIPVIRYLIVFFQTYKPSLIFLVWMILVCSVRNFNMDYYEFRNLILGFLAIFSLAALCSYMWGEEEAAQG